MGPNPEDAKCLRARGILYVDVQLKANVTTSVGEVQGPPAGDDISH